MCLGYFSFYNFMSSKSKFIWPNRVSQRNIWSTCFFFPSGKRIILRITAFSANKISYVHHCFCPLPTSFFKSSYKKSNQVSVYLFKNQTKCVSCSELLKESEQMHLRYEVPSFVSLIVSESWLNYWWSFPESFMGL